MKNDERTPKWHRAAFLDIGVVKEIPGPEDNPRIIEALRVAGVPAALLHDETAWCGAYVTLRLLEAGIPRDQIPKAGAWARSYLNFGRPCEPRRGCIVVIERGEPGGSAHVGFLEKIEGGQVWILGGNQSDTVNIKRFPRSAVLGFRWPLQGENEEAADA